MTQSPTKEPCVISVAITGSVPRKKDNPAVPITIAEQIESTHEAYEAGATLVHLHVRDEDERSSSDRHRFAELQDGIRKHCPDIIIQFSTGGRGRSFEQRGAMLDLKPDMASLATGSVNFPTIVYENPPDFVRSLAQTMLDQNVKPEIEIFDLAMLYSTVDLVNQGLLKSPVHVQFVLGVKNALPARREILEFEVEQLKKNLPDATWTAAGIGRHQLEVNHWTLQLGGHCRTGLEDNVRWDKDTLAKSNAQLVSRVASLCAEYGRPVASAKEARKLLSL
ncbi:PF05853 family protein [Caballeronia hypogeia]|uniref:PF05853 family protein n=1 Tax=Caballeronia hypogeia TaxID=1777140 RepID=A0A158BQ21_9BURK|nr:3-keto-5-aminohexanoate cleavage protein [Caballeronia hypogeia]SAK72192.1 PF05853 family protein [Caballeronia hypogeia]